MGLAWEEFVTTSIITSRDMGVAMLIDFAERAWGEH